VSERRKAGKRRLDWCDCIRARIWRGKIWHVSRKTSASSRAEGERERQTRNRVSFNQRSEIRNLKLYIRYPVQKQGRPVPSQASCTGRTCEEHKFESLEDRSPFHSELTAPSGWCQQTSHRPDPSVLFCHSGNSSHPWAHLHGGRAAVPRPDGRSFSDLSRHGGQQK
jgi:hypothetical protein